MIYRALKANLLTQGFGIANTSPALLPFYQSFGLLGHNGFDWLAQDGEPVYFDCAGKGKVLNTEIDSKGGLGVNIITEDAGGIFKHRYWHLKKFACVAGQEVETGDLIGYADSTGWATGAHLHRDMKPMLKNSLGNYYVAHPDNGHGGCVDMTPYFSNIFVKDLMDNYVKQISIYQKIIDLTKKLIDIFRR